MAKPAHGVKGFDGPNHENIHDGNSMEYKIHVFNSPTSKGVLTPFTIIHFAEIFT